MRYYFRNIYCGSQHKKTRKLSKTKFAHTALTYKSSLQGAVTQSIKKHNSEAYFSEVTMSINKQKYRITMKTENKILIQRAQYNTIYDCDQDIWHLYFVIMAHAQLKRLYWLLEICFGFTSPWIIKPSNKMCALQLFVRFLLFVSLRFK